MHPRVAHSIATLLGAGAVIVGATSASTSARQDASPPRTPDLRTAGPAACKKCHPEVFATWESSPHGKTSRPLATPDGGADLAIGSSWMQGYLRKDESGLHRLLPHSFDVQAQLWRSTDDVLDAIQGPIMPEEQGRRPPRRTEKRSFEKDCSGCHVSGTHLRWDPETERIAGGWRDSSIDCESCHGPAGAHVEAWERLDDGEPLLRLERFDTRAATGVCTRCHGGSPVGSSFTPNDAEHWVALPLTGPGVWSHGAATGQIYQADAFFRSACYLQGELSCTGCHDWHGGGMRHTEHADALCTRCHSQYASRDHTHHSLSDEGGRCVSCHMPRLLDGLLSHQRDHRISSPLPAAAEAPDACTACHRDEDKAWAAEWAEKWWGPPSEVRLGAVAGVELARRGDLEAARPLLERAAAHPDPFFRYAAASWLAEPGLLAGEELPEGRLLAIHLAGQRPDGEQLLRAALEDPSPVLRAHAYVALEELGAARVEPPVADLEVAARVSRDAADLRVVLARAYLAQSRVEPAVDLLEETVVFRKRDPDAWLVLAGAYVMAERDDASAAAVRRWSETTEPLPHLESLVTKLDEADEVELARAVLAAAAAHLPDRPLRSKARRRLNRYEELRKGGAR